MAFFNRQYFILIVDDNEDLANSLAFLLELAGFEVEVVYDGTEALRAAAARRPDIMLLDIGLPGLDGFQVAELFRRDERLKSVFIIALSAYSPDMHEKRSLRAAFDHRLMKPVEFPDLLSHLRKAIRLLPI